jgi:hypothetical protein
VMLVSWLLKNGSHQSSYVGNSFSFTQSPKIVYIVYLYFMLYTCTYIYILSDQKSSAMVLTPKCNDTIKIHPWILKYPIFKQFAKPSCGWTTQWLQAALSSPLD